MGGAGVELGVLRLMEVSSRKGGRVEVGGEWENWEKKCWGL